MEEGARGCLGEESDDSGELGVVCSSSLPPAHPPSAPHSTCMRTRGRTGRACEGAEREEAWEAQE